MLVGSGGLGVRALPCRALSLRCPQDTAIARYLDEGSAATLNGLMIARNSDIINEISGDDAVPPPFHPSVPPAVARPMTGF